MEANKMKSVSRINKILHSHKRELRENYGVKKIGLFGSCVRKEATLKSDIDVLVELGEPMGFFKFMRLERRLSELLGVKVDLVTKNALKPHIGRRILKEVIYV